MKNYLIDELTFKKFVQKVKSSVDGDQVTAVIKQEHNDRWNSLKILNIISVPYICLGKRLRSGKILSEKTPKEKEKSNPKNQPSPRQLRNGKQLPSPNPPKNQTNQQTSTKNKPDPNPNQPTTSPNNRRSPRTRTSPTGTTDSNVKKLWTNLEEPISYSGNAAAILNKIKSFK